MIKINLIREGRAAVRGVAATGGAAAAPEAANLNNQLLVGFIVIGLLAGGGYWFMRKSALDAIKEQVVQKQQEAQSLDRIIKEVEDFKKRKAALEERIALINDLKKNQKVPVKVMDRISQDLPDLLWLDKMNLTGSAISIDGRALNPNAVALFTDNLKQDPMFDEPIVRVVALTGGNNVYSFSMSFNVKQQKPEDAQTDGADAPAGGVPGGTPGG